MGLYETGRAISDCRSIEEKTTEQNQTQGRKLTRDRLMPFWQLSPVCSGCGALQKGLQHLTAFRFQNAPGNLHLMVKLGHFQYIQDGSGASGLGIHAAHDDFGDTGLHDGTGAHLAGLQCHIEGTFFQTPVTDDFAGFVDRCDLRMRQCIFSVLRRL